MELVQQFNELDISMESSAVVTLEDLLSSLNSKMAEITLSGNISRHQAQVLVEQYAVQFESRCPIQSFTQIPSTTNFQIAQEGIIATIGEKVWELIKAAGELLKRVFKWIIDFVTFRKLRDRQAAEVAENIIAAHEAAVKLKESTHLSLTEEVQKLASADFDALYSGLTDDFLKSGRYIRMVRSMQPGVATVGAMTEARLDFIERYIERLNTNTQKNEDINKDSVGLFESTALRVYMPSLKKAGIPEPNNPKSAREWVQSALITITKENLVKLTPIDAVTAMRMFNEDSNALRDPILMLPDELQKSLDKNMRALENIRQKSLPTATAQDQAVIQKLVQTAIDDAMSVQVFMSVVNLVATARDKLIAALWKYSSYTYESLYNESAAVDDPHISKLIQDNAYQLKRRLKTR